MLSKLKIMTEIISATVTKRRLILDCLTSGTSGESAQRERVVLPLVTDVVHDTLRLMKLQRRGKLTQHCVLDSTDAFFRIPLHPEERSFLWPFTGIESWYGTESHKVVRMVPRPGDG